MQTRRFVATLTLSLVTIAMATLGISQVHAVDGKNYPGSMCVRWSGTSTPVYNFSAIGNPSSTTWLYLDCPAVKDASNIASGWVRMLDRHYSSNISCRLYSVYASTGGYYGWVTPVVSSTGSSANPQHRPFGGIGGNSIAHYYYSCSIPPTYSGYVSYITSYQVSEND
jgi:hypothetical protein